MLVPYPFELGNKHRCPSAQANWVLNNLVALLPLGVKPVVLGADQESFWNYPNYRSPIPRLWGLAEHL